MLQRPQHRLIILSCLISTLPGFNVLKVIVNDGVIINRDVSLVCHLFCRSTLMEQLRPDI